MGFPLEGEDENGLGMVVGELSRADLLLEQGGGGLELALEHLALWGDGRVEHDDSHVGFVGGGGNVVAVRHVPYIAVVAGAEGGVKGRVLDGQSFVSVAGLRR